MVNVVARKVVVSDSSSSDEKENFSERSSQYHENIDAPVTGFEELERQIINHGYVLMKFIGKNK